MDGRDGREMMGGYDSLARSAVPSCPSVCPC